MPAHTNRHFNLENSGMTSQM